MIMLELGDNEFQRIRDIMYAHSGVCLSAHKKQLVISRLRKRLADLKLAGFQDYLGLIERPGSTEMSNFINAITTNETYFFRHSAQFNVLYEKILPELVAAKRGGAEPLKLWSAACATGEEPYSLAITCLEFFKMSRAPIKWVVYASDINDEVLERAKRGFFPDRSLRKTPDPIKDRYFYRVHSDEDPRQAGYELDHALKGRVEFLTHNLLAPFVYMDMDVVFLRNAMIYFDETARHKVTGLVTRAMRSGGYLFISPSESLKAEDYGLLPYGSSIYRKL
ncbi:MAG TPA: hypothetical protein DCL35_07190 [Candidatus Omnitrophica bacterium]|nr:hypothetical protein [Candidatus Omnitrophota bacterium]